MRAGARGQIAGSVAACSDNLRNPNLRRAQASFGLMWAGDWAATVAAGVVAFDHGGPAAVGVVGVARMVPAALVAALAATVADRGQRQTVLACELVAEGTVIHGGSRLVIANTKVTHGGRTVAVATGTTALSPSPARGRR
jgi:hypothetical protein